MSKMPVDIKLMYYYQLKHFGETADEIVFRDWSVTASCNSFMIPPTRDNRSKVLLKWIKDGRTS